MNVLTTPLTPTSAIVSGVPLNLASSMVCIPKNPLLNTFQSMVSSQPMRMIPFVLPGSSSDHNTQSMPWASYPFSFGMPYMTSRMSSSVSTTNVNSSFDSRGMMPPYVPFSFCGGHIPQPYPTIGGWNPPSPDLILASMLQDGVLKWVVSLLTIFHPSFPLPPH
jgi:hypothetical protein